ncbi:MAG: DUF6538 domain-containing protein [Janthinobacterium lividum]
MQEKHGPPVRRAAAFERDVENRGPDVPHDVGLSHRGAAACPPPARADSRPRPPRQFDGQRASPCARARGHRGWLEQRARGWYAVKDVPRPLQASLGKKRLIRSLHTQDHRLAVARRLGGGVGVPAGLAWRDTLQRLDGGEPAMVRAFGGVAARPGTTARPAHPLPPGLPPSSPERPFRAVPSPNFPHRDRHGSRTGWKWC